VGILEDLVQMIHCVLKDAVNLVAFLYARQMAASAAPTPPTATPTAYVCVHKVVWAALHTVLAAHHHLVAIVLTAFVATPQGLLIVAEHAS
tara:strand:+ start:72 stop:344 length:273 start_codon:yes stop_codon:yes gene_type:complete